MTEEQTWYLIIALALMTIPFAVFDFIRVQRSKHHPAEQEHYYMTQFRHFGFIKVRRSARSHQFDYFPEAKATFEEQLAAAEMKPDIFVQYGQNAFAWDQGKRELLIQSNQTPDGVLLRDSDVLVYELLCGVDVVAQGVRDGRHMPLALREDMADCDRLELQIETKHKDYPQIELVLMPFRFEKAEARASAMDAARRIVEALDEVLGERA